MKTTRKQNKAKGQKHQKCWTRATLAKHPEDYAKGKCPKCPACGSREHWYVDAYRTRVELPNRERCDCTGITQDKDGTVHNGDGYFFRSADMSKSQDHGKRSKRGDLHCVHHPRGVELEKLWREQNPPVADEWEEGRE